MIILTTWCIFISFSSLFIIGIPVRLLLQNRDTNNDMTWIYAPFYGLAAIVLLLQNPVYLDIPISISAFILFGAAVLLWIWLIIKIKIIYLFKKIPWRIIVCALLVYSIHAMGLLILGVKYYVARAWHDQYNYICTAQFLSEFPFNASFKSITNPYLSTALNAKADRIGQSVFHAFLSVITFTDAKLTFETSILLVPFLIVLAVYGLARQVFNLDERKSLLTASAAGLLPAIAMVHIECFFSQAMVIPLLLIWPLIVNTAINKPNFKTLLSAAFIFAAGNSIYTEYFIVFLGMAAVVTAINAIKKIRSALTYLIALMLLLWTTFILNLNFIEGVVNITKRTTAKAVLTGIYPWARSLEGMNRIWLGDLAVSCPLIIQKIVCVFSVILIIAVLSGLCILIFKHWDAQSVSVAALASLPLFIFLMGESYNYQFYKLLLSVSPLFPLFIALAVQSVQISSLQYYKYIKVAGGFISINLIVKSVQIPSLRYYKYFKVAGGFASIILLLILALATMDLTIRPAVGKTEEKIGRGGAHKLISLATRNIQDILSNMQGENIYIIWSDDFYNGNYILNWLAYFARKNYVWAANLETNMQLCAGGIPQSNSIMPSSSSIKNITRASHSYLLTTAMFTEYLKRNSIELIWSGAPYYLWEFSQENFNVLLTIVPHVSVVKKGFGPYDLVNLSEAAGKDGIMDFMLNMHIHGYGEISSIELQNTGGVFGKWDTIPGNGHVLIGVAEKNNPQLLINKPDGSIRAEIKGDKDFILYVADNTGFAGGQTEYRAILSFADGRKETVPVKDNS